MRTAAAAQYATSKRTCLTYTYEYILSKNREVSPRAMFIFFVMMWCMEIYHSIPHAIVRFRIRRYSPITSEECRKQQNIRNGVASYVQIADKQANLWNHHAALTTTH